MKKLVYLITLLMIFVSCENKKQEPWSFNEENVIKLTEK